MSRNQVSPPVRVSQNFLTSRRLIEALVDRASLSPADHVVEIGPGKGHITSVLLSRCARVSAVEIDDRLCAALRAKFLGNGALRLYCQDFMTWRLPKAPYKVFANIPFSRTTDIVRKLTECAQPPVEAWLTMERGAAVRFMGGARESLRSLSLKPRFDVAIAHRFHRGDFHPMPGVDVVLVHIRLKRRPDVLPGEASAYRRFIEAGIDGFGGLYARFGRRRVARALAAAGIAPDVAPAEMRYVQWLCLFRCLSGCPASHMPNASVRRRPD